MKPNFFKLSLAALALTYADCSPRRHFSDLSQKTDTATTPAKLVPGELYLETALALLKEPIADDESIDIIHFNFFTESGETRRLADHLIALKASKPSVKVRVILEGEKDAGTSKGAATRNAKTKELLRTSGIEVYLISGVQTGSRRGVVHAKAIRVANTVLTGSTNLTNTSLQKNNEFNVLVRSVQHARTIENYASELIANSSTLIPVVSKDRNVTLLTDNLFYDRAATIIDTAVSGDNLDVATYFFAYRTDADHQSRAIFDSIVRAHNRGAKVRVLLEQTFNTGINPTITQANQLVAKKLRESGLTGVYLDKLEKISHSKIIKLSGPNSNTVLLGSTNLYRGDFEDNHQINVEINDANLVAQVTAYLNQKIAYETESTMPTPMMRFWRGYKQNGVSSAEFIKKLNDSLIPELGAIGPGRGLTAYLPTLLPNSNSVTLPDEIALIQYESSDVYDAIRSTPRGRGYGPLHFAPGLFAKETISTSGEVLKSSSTIVMPWQGRAETGRAYGIEHDTSDWQSLYTTVQILVRRRNVSDQDFLSAANTYLESHKQNTASGRTKSVIVLLDRDYILTYVGSVSPTRTAEQFDADVFELEGNTTLTHFDFANTKIGHAKGVNVQFNTKLLDQKALIAPLLENL